MSESMTMILIAGAGLAALAILVLAGLKAWAGWLDVRRFELSGHRQEPRSPAMDLIEMADLKERIRKLESIAACIDL